jgi:phospholipase/carboxylesterase
MNSDRRTVPLRESETGLGFFPEARFLPHGYEPNYAYPLLVMFHGRGGDEHQLVTMMPALSWRNYVGLSLRGPEVVSRQGREIGHSWGSLFARPDRSARHELPRISPAESVRRILTGGPFDALDRLENGVFGAIRELRRTTHVHSERIYLTGIGEGAAVAYRLALSHPDRFAGVVAINGWLPAGAPLFRVKDCRSLRILVVHGEWNDRCPIQGARRDVATLRAAGLRVAFHAYPCGHRLTGPMLADIDAWLMHQCTSSTV